MSSDRDDNLSRIIIGIEKTIEITTMYNEETHGGVLDGNEESEFIYGLAMIAMQNYINMICVDCYIISADKTKLEDFSKRLRGNADKLPLSNYTFVELIYTLANAIKHRNELEIECSKIITTDDGKYTIQNSYRKDTKDVLNDFDLLTPLSNMSCEWEIYPIIKGVRILDCDYNLHNITERLFDWAEKVKSKSSKEARNKV